MKTALQGKLLFLIGEIAKSSDCTDAIEDILWDLETVAGDVKKLELESAYLTVKNHELEKMCDEDDRDTACDKSPENWDDWAKYCIEHLPGSASLGDRVFLEVALEKAIKECK